jgi:protein-L-isoaspartate O-methyltransferase
MKITPRDIRYCTTNNHHIKKIIWLRNQAKMFSPKIEGRLLDALNIKSHETVLEIGTGSGYLTTVVAKLCQSITSVGAFQIMPQFPIRVR